MWIVAAFEIFTEIKTAAQVARIFKMGKGALANLVKKPRAFASKLASLPRAQANRVRQLLKLDTTLAGVLERYNIDPTKLSAKALDVYKSFKEKPKELAQKLSQLSQKERKEVSQELQKAHKVEVARLSSSWLAKGEWRPTNGSGQVGELILWTKNGNTGYAYPGVSYETWLQMKAAKGRNGGGAGTVFWAKYLRGYKSTTTYKILKQSQKYTNIKGIKKGK